MKDDRNQSAEATRWQASLRLLLPAMLAALVVLAVAPVIVFGYVIASDTSQRLLSERAELILDGIEQQIRGQLDPVVDQMGYVRQAVAGGLVQPDDGDQLPTLAFGLLAGTPQVFGIGLIGSDFSMRRWERDSFAEFNEPPERLPFSREAIEAARAGDDAYWAPPFFSIALGDTILNYRVALRRGSDLLGVLAVAVTSEGLARYVAETSQQFGVTAFVFSGRDKVIAYPGSRAPDEARTSTRLTPITSISDPVLARIWEEQNPLTQTSRLSRSAGHWAWIDDVAYAYFYRELTDYGPEPMLVGVAIPAADTRFDRWAPTIAAAIGSVLMLLAAVAAWWVGKRLGQPAIRLNAAHERIAEMRFDEVAVPELEQSRVREWRVSATRLREAARALQAFQTYLPRALVRRLFEAGEQSIASQQRDVTVMFIDLEGFTAFAGRHDAGEVAGFLNARFARIGPLIEAEGGVIDKYTGDGLMAFWGAPDAMADHARRAGRAAARIVAILASETPPDENAPRTRIGLHTGPAIVGNVGFPGRIDYTLVGDTVNTAERTETALRGIKPERPVVIAATTATLKAIGADDPPLVAETELDGVPRPAFVCRPAPTPRAST